MQTTTDVFQFIVVTDVKSEEVYLLVLYNITDECTISGALNITIETGKHCRQPYTPPCIHIYSHPCGLRHNLTEHKGLRLHYVAR